MNLVIKNIIRFILIMAVQLFVLNNVPPLHQFIVPYFYFVFILWLPFKITRTALLFVAFAVGYFTDMFYKTPGLHLAACVLIAYVRPPFIQLLLPKEATEYCSHDTSSSFLFDFNGVASIWKFLLLQRKVDCNNGGQFVAHYDCRSFTKSKY